MPSVPAWLVSVRLVLTLLLFSSTWKLLLIFKARRLLQRVSTASYLKSAQYLPIQNIDFTSARGLKRNLDGTINNPESVSNESVVHTTTGQVESTSEELDQLDLNLFFQDISK